MSLLNRHDLIERQCKIRKRGCSSSSSSSLVRRYRLKRAILVGKRAGSSTPVPTWKTSTSPRSPANFAAMPKKQKGLLQQQQQQHSSKDDGKGKEVMSVSARKLAATLWEINEVSVLKSKESKREEGVAPMPPKLADPSYSPISERKAGSGGGHQRRLSAVSHRIQLTDHYLGEFETHSNRSVIEVKDQSHGKTDRKCLNTCLKEVGNGLTTSKELVKILTRVCCLEEQKNSLYMPLLTALQAELDRARVQVHQFIREQRSNCKEIEYLMKHFAEEKAAWKSKEREKVRAAVACIAEELEVEKKLRKQTERLNKKLGKELEDKNVALSKATKELEREKRAKEIFEQVCDELAVGMGEDRAHVEELKRESERVREEVEKEREMLQLADVLREERVQMKLSEAKYHFEEKNAAVEQLKNELEGYLRSHKGEGSGYSPDIKRIKELEAYLKKINFGSFQTIKERDHKKEVAFREECDEEDSGDDCHSIELNMDNSNRMYKWSYAFGDDAEDDSKRSSVDKQFKGRRSLSEKIQWENICLNKSSTGTDWGFGSKTEEHEDGDHTQERETETRQTDHLCVS
ncbi:uncharacterized protein LOC126788369 [Argentina anserina]|uniref:uncharacterized protein LOC126788369 n=1 Tax=Argentina anserina TaxID=57926 RepID=UPI0021764233|nr:uncharacterized protein LOC126788369 [Potentilla anserina]